MTDHTPLTEQQLADIESALPRLREYTEQSDAVSLVANAVPVLLAVVRRLEGQRKFLVDQLAKKDAESGAGDRALREFLNGQDEPAPSPAVADAPDPTPLRWGLNDVMWGDDDSVTVLLSGPDGEPFWLELDAERAAVLRQDLAGPEGAPEAAVDESGTSPCGHDDYHGPHEWADRPGTWCSGISYADDEPTP